MPLKKYEVACKQEAESRRVEVATDEVACEHLGGAGNDVRKTKGENQMRHNIDENKVNWRSMCVNRELEMDRVRSQVAYKKWKQDEVDWDLR